MNFLFDILDLFIHKIFIKGSISIMRFKKFFVKGAPSKTKRRQRGQAMFLFVLFVPLLFIFAGVGLDLGWYYLNVSRLQNAADAAAVAGAYEMIKDEESFKDYEIILVENKFTGYPEPDADIDTTPGDKVAAEYARKNLSSDNEAEAVLGSDNSAYACTITDKWSREETSEVTMTPHLGQEGENFYYVVHLMEEVQHFFMPGRYDPMLAPVVAVAMVTKRNEITSGGDLSNKKIVLDANGDKATLTDENGDANKKQRNVNVPAKEDGTGYNDTPLPTASNISLYRDGYTFTGWNTQPDGSGIAFSNGKNFKSSEINSLFGGNETVILYAQWEKKTIYIAGDSLYNAMKGNSTKGTKGLEELMTYNTWYAMYKLDMHDTYSVYPEGGASVYSGGYFRTETTNINSKVASSKTNNFNIFLDLGSDLMYNNNASSSGKGLFKYSWDVSDIPNYSSTLASIVAAKNSNVSSNPNLTYNFTLNTSSITKADAIKYRVHTRFNIDAAWTVRTKYYNNSNSAYTSSKYVAYVRECLKTVLNALQKKYGTSKKISGISTLSEDIDAIIENNNGIPLAYKTCIKNFISNYSNYQLSSSNISTIVNGCNPATLIPATDPLYVRIESEELNEADGDRQNTSIRQMFINVNTSNTASNARPLVIFYEGPDRGLTEGVDDSERADNQSGSPKEAYPNLSWRDSQPVILNLNADFRGILFAPNSPVVINGNGKNFYGFVVAKEFVRVTTENDYTVKNGKYFDGNGKEWFKSSQTSNGITNTVFVDQYGNVDTRHLENATRPLGANETLAGVSVESEITAYKAQHTDKEVVYKLNAFNVGSNSHYDWFDIPELERHVYNYLNAKNSVDMFFTTIRSRWVT